MQKNVKIGIVIIVVIAVAAVLWYNYSGSSGGANLAQYDNQPVPQPQISQLQSIADNTSLADNIGVGAIGSYPAKINDTNLIINGKPGVLYIGADYCPYCAAGRWGLILALMRFGSLSGLEYMTSSASDVYPNTPTFTFANSTYQSGYIGFASKETFTNTYPYKPLQTLSAWENSTFNKYDSCSTCGIPFIDFGNRSVQRGSNYNPQTLDNNNWNQIIAQLSNPNTAISQSVIGSADVFTAQICSIDNFTPASVCGARYVQTVLKG